MKDWLIEIRMYLLDQFSGSKDGSLDVGISIEWTGAGTAGGEGGQELKSAVLNEECGVSTVSRDEVSPIGLGDFRIIPENDPATGNLANTMDGGGHGLIGDNDSAFVGGCGCIDHRVVGHAGRKRLVEIGDGDIAEIGKSPDVSENTEVHISRAVMKDNGNIGGPDEMSCHDDAGARDGGDGAFVVPGDASEVEV